jgi:hypothetical protein
MDVDTVSHLKLNDQEPDSKQSRVEKWIPFFVVAILLIATLAFAELFGLLRLTMTIQNLAPSLVNFGSIGLYEGRHDGTIGNIDPLEAAASPPEPEFGPVYEATPDRVWQTTGRQSGVARRAILYLVSNGTGSKERKRIPEDFPPGFGGIDGPDGYYVQHLLYSLQKAEKALLSKAQHPDVIIVHAEDVDGPRLAREASKYTESAVVAQQIVFTRTAPGYENKTDGLTTCWPVDWSIN